MRRLFLYSITAMLLTLLPGCWRHAPSSQALREIQSSYEELPAKAPIKEPNASAVLEEATISMDSAIQFALEYNENLQAFLENIGIARADLVQAGLYSNPHTSFAARSPDESSRHNVEIDSMINVADIWQVPLRHRMTEHEYAALQHHVIRKILDTILETKQAYIECMYTQADRDTVYNMYQEAQNLRDRIYLRFQHGYSHTLDLHLADTNVDRWYITYQQTQASLRNAIVHLEHVLGITHYEERELTPSDPFIIQSLKPLPSYELLHEHAQINRPEIQEIEERINQYHSQIRYEQSLVFPHIGLGVAFERELDGTNLRGPAISFDVPLFDANQAHISQAEHLKRRTQKELYAMIRDIESEISIPLHNLQSLSKALKTYRESTLDHISQGIDFAQHYADQKRLTVPTLIQTRMTLYETHREYLETLRQIWHQTAHLERALGSDLRDYLVTETVS